MLSARSWVKATSRLAGLAGVARSSVAASAAPRLGCICSAWVVPRLAHRTRFFSTAVESEARPLPSPEAEEGLKNVLRERHSERNKKIQQFILFLSRVRTPGDLYLIEKALDEFQASKVSVDPRLSAAIVDACIRIPDAGLPFACSLFEGHPSRYGMVMSPASLGKLMAELNGAGRHESAITLFYDYETMKMSLPLHVYEELFASIAGGDRIMLDMAVATFEKLRTFGPLPKPVTYFKLLGSLHAHESYDVMMMILEQYEEDGFRHTAKSVGFKIHALTGLGKTQEAVELQSHPALQANTQQPIA